MTDPRIFVDCDGVLAFFNKRAKELIGEDYIEYDKRLWKVISKHENFFQELEPMPDAFILWDYIKKYSPSILTALPHDGTLPLARQHKTEWVAKHFGGEVPVLFGHYAADKLNHCEPGAILVDNNPQNCLQWQTKGGLAIFHKDAKTTIKCLKFLNL